MRKFGYNINIHQLIAILYVRNRTFPVVQMVKNLLAMQETRDRSLGQEDPWRRRWQSTPVFVPGEFHG